MIRFVDEFRNKTAARRLVEEIRSVMPQRKISYMEICGGHTLTAVRYGIHGILPRNLVLKSGPGCPVCVTPSGYIDTAIRLSHEKDVIIASFGDMLKVPGATGTLLQARSTGADVRICLSPLEAVAMAETSPQKQVIFLGIGFETTAPAISMAVLKAQARGLKNFSILPALKTMPQAMAALMENKEVALDGFICPGHVTAVAGADMYNSFIEKYQIPCVVSGFEPTDMLLSVLMLLKQTISGRAETEIQYTRAVTRRGNRTAQQVVTEVFQPADAVWRGLGIIPQSGLGFRDICITFDACYRFDIKETNSEEPEGCRCGDVMRGILEPSACPLFGKACTPDSPLGACMVSAEGACGIYFRYRSAGNT